MKEKNHMKILKKKNIKKIDELACILTIHVSYDYRNPNTDATLHLLLNIFQLGVYQISQSHKVTKKEEDPPKCLSVKFHQTAWVPSANFKYKSNPLLKKRKKAITYPCVSNLENKIDQWDAFLNGAWSSSHVRAVPSSSSSSRVCVSVSGNGTAYVSCYTSRCHF